VDDLESETPPLSPFVSTAAVGFLLDFWNAIQLQRFTMGALPVFDIDLFVGLVVLSRKDDA